MFDGLQLHAGRRGVSWLPLYHDMGLIGFVIAPLYALVQVMFLPTMAFIRRPSLWLDAIHRFRGTITFAPNFAYALATRARHRGAGPRAGISRACARSAAAPSRSSADGAPRVPRALRRSTGLQPESAPPLVRHGRGDAGDHLRRRHRRRSAPTAIDLARACAQGEAEPRERTARAMELVSCGRAFPGHEIARRWAPAGAPRRAPGRRDLAPRPSVTAGYFGDPEATDETFGGGWLRTGDLGYLADGELFICGRAKDLIILNGQQLLPAGHRAHRLRGRRHPRRPVRRLLALRRQRRRDRGRRRRVAQEHAPGVAAAVDRRGPRRARAHVAEVHFIKRGTLPKTSSGKVRRRECKRRLDDAELELVSDTTSSGTSIARHERTRGTARQAARTAAAPCRPRKKSRKESTMGSSKADVEVSYDVSNEFFRLWLDERMNYTSRRLRDPGPVARGRAAQQAQDPLRLRQGHAREDGARHRLRLGRVPRVPRRPRAR